MAIGTILGLISLASALASSGIGIGKGAKSKEEQRKVNASQADIDRYVKEQNRLLAEEGRRKAVAAAIGSRLNVYQEPPKEPNAPYQPKDLSSFDTGAQIAGSVGSLVGQGAQLADSNGGSNNINEPSSTEGAINNIDTNSNGLTNGNLALAKPRSEYNRYGYYLSRNGNTNQPYSRVS